MNPIARTATLIVTVTVGLSHTCCAPAVASDAPTGTPPELLVIPIEIRDGFPILKANVNGLEISLKFDLGDGDSLVLQQGVLNQLGAKATGETAKMRGIDGVFEAPLYLVPSFRIGTATFENVVARSDVRAGGYKPGEQGEKGFLGTGLLKDYVIAFNYPSRTMTLVPRAQELLQSKYCSGIEVPFLPDWNGAPVTEVVTDWGRAILWWDTGAPVSAMRESFLQGPGPKREEDPVTTEKFLLGGTNLGPVVFHFWAMELPKFDGFVGYNFFARHVVCVDFPGHKLIVEVADRRPTIERAREAPTTSPEPAPEQR